MTPIIVPEAVFPRPVYMEKCTNSCALYKESSEQFILSEDWSM